VTPDSARHLLQGRCWLALGGLVACVNTDLEPTTETIDCAATPLDTAAASEAVVLVVQQQSREFALRCSGVAVAPNLIATALSCVSTPPQSGFECDEGWSPIESGNFAAWIEPPASAEPLSVQRARRTATGELLFDDPIDVLQIVSSRSVSGCTDDLAFLVLAGDLAVPRLPVRVTPGYRADEPVVVRGVSPESNQSADARVAVVTSSTGDEVTPPRGLLIDAPVCSPDRGGAVFAARSGALIGLVLWPAGAECGDQTVALQLAPFRRLLLDAADVAGATLLSEAPLEDGTACMTQLE
jgi:hypothetical protein